MSGTLDFFRADYPATLFPLRTNFLLIDKAHKQIHDFIYSEVLVSNSNDAFLPQQRAYAAKPRHHLRRTFKLDPVAEYFIYDIVYRNRNIFRKPFRPNRQFFGYRFEKGAAIAGRSAYAAFRQAIEQRRKKFKFELSFDIASYFNSIYHHDLVHWFSAAGASEADSQALGQYLREINAGRSIDCLPQGIYPCKMIGSAFLSTMETSERIRASESVRFMDDFHLFDRDDGLLIDDFSRIQRLLGERGLSINPQKTRLPDDPIDTSGREVDQIKKSLLEKRRKFKVSALEGSDSEREKVHLSEEQQEYLLSLLKDHDLEEPDAELILTVMHEHSDEVSERFVDLTTRFPNLSRELYQFCQHVPDKEELASSVLKFLQEAEQPTEFQLFWLGAIVEDYLRDTRKAGKVMLKLMEHEAATQISKAKVLEIPETRFAMPDLRAEYLRSGQSDWAAWAAAIGSRTESAERRNYIGKYFAKASRMNRLIAECLPAVSGK